jgi:mRNA interferase RelE/StbE
MIYRRTERFRKAYENLSDELKEKVKKAFFLFQQDFQHPSLRTKQVQSAEGVWEGRIDRSYRFTFHFEDDAETGERKCVFRNVGPHDILDKNP